MIHLIGNLYSVEVPSDYILKIEPRNEYISYTSREENLKFDGESQLNYVPIGFDFKIIGEVSKYEISFDVDPYVEELEPVRYRDYLGNREWFAMKNNSFRSLLQSKGIYFENPIEKLDVSDFDNGVGIEYDNFYRNVRLWQESENKVIKGKLIILEKL